MSDELGLRITNTFTQAHRGGIGYHLSNMARILVFPLVLIGVLFTTLAFSQEREISQDEFISASNQWTTLSESSYPRRVTSISGDGKSSETTMFKDSNTYKSVETSPDGVIETIRVGGLYYFRSDGKWECSASPRMVIGRSWHDIISFAYFASDVLGTREYTAAHYFIDENKTRRYLEKRVYTVDASGRLVKEAEYDRSGKELFSTKYEYDIYLDPIVQPLPVSDLSCRKYSRKSN